VLGELQKMESTKTGNLDTFEQMKLDLRAKSNELQTCIEILEQKQRQLSTETINSHQLQETVSSYKNELGTELFSQLSNEDKQQLLLVNEEISKLKDILIVAARTQVDLESSKKNLSNQLNSNLRKREEKIQEEIDRIQFGSTDLSIEEFKRELENVKVAFEKNELSRKKIEEKIEENNQTIKKSKSELETKKANSNKHRKEVQESSKIRETLTNEKEILEERRIQKEKELKNLGVLPVNEIEALKNQNIKELTRQLGAIKIDLEKRKKINSNATDQYVESSNRREILQQRKDEIDKSLEKIEVLMNTLEQEREKKIDYTVKQAGFHFKEIFKLLTDNEGEGKLVLKYPKLSKTTSKTASGLDMVVTFKQGEKPTPINSLSGGQKTICALALIFAIQKCDRAPFYLFDEIDANLDSAKKKKFG